MSFVIKRLIIAAGFFVIVLDLAVAVERNRFDSVQEQLPSYEIEVHYDDGSPRSVWIEEPALVDLSIGTVEIRGTVSLWPNGVIESARFSGMFTVDTPAGPVETYQVHFHENGALERVHFEEAQVVTPAGAARAFDYVSFHDDGGVSELPLAAPFELTGEFGSVAAERSVHFYRSGALRLIHFGHFGESRIQAVVLPTGEEAIASKIHLHENGAVSMVTFSEPTVVQTSTGHFDDAVVATYDADGELDIVGLAQARTFETPGGSLVLRGVALFPDGTPAGGFLAAPRAFETPIGNRVLIVAIFNQAGDLMRAAPVEPVVIDGARYDYRTWMVFDSAGAVIGSFPSTLLD